MKTKAQFIEDVRQKYDASVIDDLKVELSGGEDTVDVCLNSLRRVLARCGRESSMRLKFTSVALPGSFDFSRPRPE